MSVVPSSPQEPASTILEEISRAECFVLLASHTIGRLAVGRPGGPPWVVPVNYVLDGELIVFRSDPGAKLDALREEPVSFQVDLIDPFHRTGWSVLVHGVAWEAAPAEHLAVEPWAPGEKPHWVRIVPDAVTGRRLRLPEIQIDGRGYL